MGRVPNWVGFAVLAAALAFGAYTLLPSGGTDAEAPHGGAADEAEPVPVPSPVNPAPITPTPAPAPAIRPPPQAPAVQPAARTLSGAWNGDYSGGGNRTTAFAVTLSGGASFTGDMAEINTFAKENIPQLFSTVRGSVDSGGFVRFTKTYDGTGGVSHSVQYQGQLSADGRSVSGTWSVQGLRGQFRMTRR